MSDAMESQKNDIRLEKSTYSKIESIITSAKTGNT
jgi:hypothetical protein